MLVFCVGIIAPWIEYKINGVEVRPFVLASIVFIGVVPFLHWFYITPDVYRDEVTKVRPLFIGHNEHLVLSLARHILVV